MTSANSVVVPEDPTVYPVDEPMGEDFLQTLILEVLRPLVARWLSERGALAFVGSDQFIYYEQYNAYARVAPDVYVLPGVAPDADVPSWKVWETGIAPSFACEVVSKDWEKDYVESPPRYGALGATELIVFDPRSQGHAKRVRWQRFARTELGQWSRVEHTDDDRIRSQVLGCWLRAVGTGQDLRIRLALDPSGDDLFPTAEEAERQAKEAALARIAELEKELERRR